MSTYVLKDAKTWYEGYDISGRLHTLSLPLHMDAKQNTTMGSDSHTYLPGMKSFSLTESGYHDNTTLLNPDDYIMTEYGSGETIVSVSPSGAQGDAAFFMKCNTSTYTPVAGGVGDVAGFTFTAQGTGDIRRGIIMEMGQETSSATGTGRELNGLDSGDVAYMAIHVYELDATSIDIAVLSDTVTTMDDSATARDFSQVQFTAVGSQYLSYTAASDLSADDCWQVNSTITGGNTTASYAVVLYIP